MSDQENTPTAPDQPQAEKVEECLTLGQQVLAKLGIHAVQGRKLHYTLKPRLFYLILTGFAALLVLLAGASVYSTKPRFCNTCHIMEPYYQAWQTSSHKSVSCVDCHYPPGNPREILWHKFQALSQVTKYVTRTYSSKPFAEIDDASCLREGCHATRLLQGKVVDAKTGVTFDHTPHLTQSRLGLQLRCTSCHSQIVIGNHMEVTWDTCYLCHLMGQKVEQAGKPLGGCRGCHILPEGEIKSGNVTFLHKDFAKEGEDSCRQCHRTFRQGEGEVSQYRCFTCHNQPEKLARFKETDFLHNNHVTTHHTPCFRCHDEIHHGEPIPRPVTDMVNECSRCHSDLHDREAQLFRGQGAQGVPDMPSPMYQTGVDCAACHLQKKLENAPASHAASLMGSEIGCSSCHGPDYPVMVSNAEKMVKETLDALDRKYAALTGPLAASTLDEGEKPKLQDQLDEVKDNLAYIHATHAPHNIFYVAGILSYVEKILTAAALQLNLTAVEKTSDLPMVSGAYCATLCHNRLGVRVPPEGIKYQGIDVNHQRHIQEGLSCRVCHELGAHKDVKFKGEDVCLNCHSEDQLKDLKKP